jgi:hypothetical protein
LSREFDRAVDPPLPGRKFGHGRHSLPMKWKFYHSRCWGVASFRPQPVFRRREESPREGLLREIPQPAGENAGLRDDDEPFLGVQNWSAVLRIDSFAERDYSLRNQFWIRFRSSGVGNKTTATLNVFLSSKEFLRVRIALETVRQTCWRSSWNSLEGRFLRARS